MPKLPASLKQLISSPLARGGPLPAPPPRTLLPILDRIRARAVAGGAGRDAWLTLSTAASVTVNSPETLCAVYDYAAHRSEATDVAEGMREVALKCISFNGIPRTINALNVLLAHWPAHVVSSLRTTPTRTPTPDKIDAIASRGRGLWDDIYAPLHDKLADKLASAHPDLIVHILNSHYGALLSDPEPARGVREDKGRVGRVLTSVVAITCLRAQTGVEPQVLSHVYGLLKAAGGAGVRGVQGGEWLTSDQGAEWVLASTDEISQAVGGSFGAKL